MSMSSAQQTIFQTMSGMSVSESYLLWGGLVIALFGVLMIKVGKGSLQGFGRGNVTGYELLSRAGRLAFLFILLVFLLQ